MLARFILALGLWAQSANAQAEFLTETGLWERGIGGLSGLEVSDDGSQFWAIGDRGLFITGRFDRDEAGLISGIVLDRQDKFNSGSKARPLSRAERDGEGLARSPQGTFFTSFENKHRVAVLNPTGLATVPINGFGDFKSLQRNSGLEALAITSEGALLAIPERSGLMTRPFPVYRFSKGAWDIPFSLPRRGEFLVVGADVGPDGRLYVLERHFLGFSGFLNRVRVFEIMNDAITSETVLIETRSPVHDNLEGISVWRDQFGDLRMTMVADDNFNPFQRTEFVEYRIPTPLVQSLSNR